MFDDDTALEPEQTVETPIGSSPRPVSSPPVAEGQPLSARPRLGAAAEDEAPTRPRVALPGHARSLGARLAPLADRARGVVRSRPLGVALGVGLAALLCGYALGGEAKEPTSVFSTRLGGVPIVRARVERVMGDVAVREGDECVLAVWRAREDHPTGESWCRTQLACGGELLYGGRESGFFTCSEEGVGRDADTTEADGDPALDLRVRDGALVLTDDAHGEHGAFRIEASIDVERAVGAR